MVGVPLGGGMKGLIDAIVSGVLVRNGTVKDESSDEG